MVIDSLEVRLKQNVDATNKSLDDMITKLNSVSKAVSGIDLKKLSGSGMVGVTQKLSTSLKTVSTSASTARSSLLSLGTAGKSTNTIMTSLWTTLRRFVGIYAVFRGLKYAIEQYSNLVEVQNRVDVTFGKSKGVLEDWAATSRTAFGVSALSAKEIASTYQAMGIAMGYSQEEMSGMSVQLTELAADMASFYDRDVTDIAKDLQAVFTGMSRPLRKYGVDLTQATLQEYANAKGIDVKVASMTQAEKTLLRYNYVLERTAAAQGDFARTQYTFANQWRVLKQNLTAFAVSVGEIIVNTLRPLIIWLNKVMERVIAFSKTIVNALGKIFGWEMQVTGGSTATDDVSDFADSLGEVGDNAGDASKGVDKVKSSVDKLKNTILGFDELNVLNDVDESTGSSGSGGSGTGGTGGLDASALADDLETAIVKTESPWKKLYESSIRDLKSLGETMQGALINAMQSIDWDSIYAKARNFGKGLAEFLNGLISPALFASMGKTLAGALNTALFAKNEFFKDFDFSNLGRSIGAGINSYFRNFRWDIAGENFALLINGIGDAIANQASTIDWNMMGEKMAEKLRVFVDKLRTSDLGRAVHDFAFGILTTMKSYLSRVPWAQIGDKIKEFLEGLDFTSLLSGVGDLVAEAINGSLTLAMTTFDFDFTEFGKELGKSFTDFVSKIKWGTVGTTISRAVLNMIETIGGFIAGADWYLVGNNIRFALENLKWKEILYSVGEVVWKAVAAALKLAAGVLNLEELNEKVTAISEAFDLSGVVNGITSLVEAVNPIVEGFMDGLVDGLASLVGIGAEAIEGVAQAIKDLAAGINMIPEDILRTIGFALGEIASALLTIAGIDAAAGLIGKLFGGAASTGAALGATGGSVVSNWLGGWSALLTGGAVALPFAASSATRKTTQSKQSWQDADAIKTALEQAYKNLTGEEAPYSAPGHGVLGDLLGDKRLTDLTKDYSSEELLSFISQDLEKVGKEYDDWFDRQGYSALSYVDLVQQALRDAESGTSQLPDAYREVFQSIVDGSSTASEATTQYAQMFSADSQRISNSSKDLYEILKTTAFGMEDTQNRWYYNTKQTNDKVIDSHNKLGDHYWKTFAKITGATQSAELEATDDTKTMASNVSSNIQTMANYVGLHGSAAFDDLSASSKKGMSETSDTVDKKNRTIGQSFKGTWSDVVSSTGLQLVLMNATLQKKMEEMKVILWGYKVVITKQAKDSISKPFEEAADSAIEALMDLPKRAYDALSDLAGTVYRAVDIDLYSYGYNAARSFINGIQSVYMPMPHITVQADAYTTPGGGYSYNMNSYLRWYSKGGFPDRGDIFIANEAGNPEMVGRIGGSPAVANNQQITDAIRDAVVEGLMARPTEDSTSPIEIVIKADSETLYRTTLKGKKKYDLRFA